MVNRYTFQDDEVGMEIDEDGYWMAYEDYEALEAKLAKSAERERVLVEALEAIRDGEVWRNKIYPSDIARSALAAKEE